MSDKKTERRGLGRGLSALMADVNLGQSDGNAARGDVVRRIAIELIVPNPRQPRTDFDDAQLDELAASITAKGVLQPLIVRESAEGSGRYEIVAGERRWRAAQRAKQHDLPVIVRSLSDAEVLEVAIIENIQRSDLNPIEEAAAYRQLMDQFGHTQDRLAEALSKSRSHIANLLRLLQLPAEVQSWLREGKLTAGHARALINTPDPTGLAREVIARGLSVREAERLATVATNRPERPRQRAAAAEKDADTRALEGDLSSQLKMRVSIDHKGQDGGVLTVTYRSLEQLDELCQRLSAML